MYLPRTIELPILNAAAQFPVLFMTGAHQVGKTTLLQYLGLKKRRYATLDDPSLLDLARQDPARFMRQFPAPVFIDEIQYAPELLPYIRNAVDKNPKPGQFWLAASRQFQVTRNVSDLLAGRVAVMQLMGLSHMECSRRAESQKPFIPDHETLMAYGPVEKEISLPDLYTTIWRGSFPALVADRNIDRDSFLNSCVQSLKRDVRDLIRVSDEETFLHFLRVAAARTGWLLNVAEMAREVGVTPNIANRWLAVLQTSGIVYLLEAYSDNMTRRLIKSPKFYFLDTGLAAYLTGWSTPEALAAGAMSGSILETWIIGELLKSWHHNNLQPPFYYYRDTNQKEIDLLIIRDGVMFPLEIAKTATPDIYTVRHFAALEKLKMPVGTGCVICLAKRVLPLAKKVWSVPIEYI